ncbi:MAG: extracellular solute-binding protein, partial [Mycobacterium sp.]|nr:extracellular solute-binding protein [Mycobacterium sp.]
MNQSKVRCRSWRTVLPAILAAAAIAISACSSSAGGSSAAKNNPNAQVVVWVDATRKAAMDAYVKAHPNAKVKVEVVDPNSVLSKIQLANRTGSGWPDVLWVTYPNQIAALSSSQFQNFALPLNKLIPQSIQRNFATKNAWCTLGGTLYCLQNDLSQSVLWYNKPLMARFGYQVPTTWDQYQALGEQVAREHPGYLIGAFGEVNLYYDLLWSSGCPLTTVVNQTEVKINTKDPKCTRVATTFDPLFADGSVSRLSPFDPATIKQAKAGKFLMMPGPSWFAQFT